MQLSQEYWFDHEKLEVYREAIGFVAWLSAVLEGAVQRVRPKLMTVSAAILSLVPIFWSTGTGSEVMRPIATPIVGGMVTSTIHVLLVTPVIFFLMKERARQKGKLQPSGMSLERRERKSFEPQGADAASAATGVTS